MFKIPDDVPEDQILVQQVATRWQITQRDYPLEDFDSLDEAVSRALTIYRERVTAHVLIEPSDSPFMR